MRKRTQSTFKIRHILPAQPIETTMNASHDLPHSSAVPAITSRLPNVGTTIFTVMCALATQTGAVNLGQGFPDFDCDPRIVDAVDDAMRAGHNQYPPMAGVRAAARAIGDKIEPLYGRATTPTARSRSRPAPRRHPDRHPVLRASRRRSRS